MTWSDFYLVCFIVGSTLSLLSFLTGAHLHIHMPFRIHLPNGWFHGGHGGAHHVSTSEPSNMSPVNFATVMAFLAWFGAMGFLLTKYYRWWSTLIFGASLVSGLAGGAIIYLFFLKVFVSRERPLRAADFDMIGVLGRLTIPIREGGTGELVYSQAGTRRSCGARSDDGAPLPKGAEVVVLRYDSGIAYVQPLGELEQQRQLEA
jgi:membrane protein implicated in regulation of membrane protease activity